MNVNYFYFKNLILIITSFLVLISCVKMTTEPEVRQLDDFIEIGEAERGSFPVIRNRMSITCTHRIKVKIKRDLDTLIFRTASSITTTSFFPIDDDTDFDSLNPIKKNQEIYIYRGEIRNSSFNTLRNFTIKRIEISFFDDNDNYRGKRFIINKMFTNL